MFLQYKVLDFSMFFAFKLSPTSLQMKKKIGCKTFMLQTMHFLFRPNCGNLSSSKMLDVILFLFFFFIFFYVDNTSKLTINL